MQTRGKFEYEMVGECLYYNGMEGFTFTTYIQKLEYIHFNIEQILVTSEVTHFYRNQSKAVFQVVLKYYKINVAQEN